MMVVIRIVLSLLVVLVASVALSLVAVCGVVVVSLHSKSKVVLLNF